MIDGYFFGKMRINGQDYTQDLKIIKGKVFPQWWRKTGHEVVPDDVQDILETQPKILILGKGNPGRMEADQELKKHLEQKGIMLLEISTEEAVKEFNRLWTSGEDVAAGFHLTC